MAVTHRAGVPLQEKGFFWSKTFTEIEDQKIENGTEAEGAGVRRSEKRSRGPHGESRGGGCGDQGRESADGFAKKLEEAGIALYRDEKDDLAFFPRPAGAPSLLLPDADQK
jgi:hypothetical protein